MRTRVERQRAQTDRDSEFLSMRLGGQEFAVKILAIREIRSWVGSTSLTHAASFRHLFAPRAVRR